ncbi:hypothetical protein [Treponema sp.]|uniref:hypothetical protein n=1 Tax=Treponema sp. TaxID=166 RepID=UPI002579A3ED|nr:hypothetical protein [Treponema sp.]MBE6355300.1 hypothetical protein [Treponema sp.]
MRRNSFYYSVLISVFCAFVFLNAACSSSGKINSEMPLKELPETSGTDLFAGRTFFSDRIFNKYIFGTDGTVEIYVADINGRWIFAGKDWYSIDEENSVLYTKIISVADAASSTVSSSPEEYERRLNKMFDGQFAGQGIKFSPESKKAFGEFKSGYVRQMAEETFNEVIEENFVFADDGKSFVLTQKAPSWFNQHFIFASEDGSVTLNSLTFKYTESGPSVIYNGNVKNMRENSFDVDLYRIEYVYEGDRAECIVRKSGLCKFEYETVSDTVEEGKFISVKKLRVIEAPEETGLPESIEVIQSVTLTPAEFVYML